MDEVKRVLGDKITYSSDPYEAVIEADAAVLVTEWSEFHMPDFIRMGEMMKNKVIFDGRNIYDPAEIRRMGFTYIGIGRR
jgi:UDPglucose 6-dehydrogenase